VTGADGVDCYHEVKAANKFKTVPRTQGVSSTDMVGRMLLLTKTHFQTPKNIPEETIRTLSQGSIPTVSPYTGVSQLITTSRKIAQFSEQREPKPTDTVVYIDGSFDLFHAGHCMILKKAKSLGDYLIVGIYDDHAVNSIKGGNHPIMNLHERVLSVLSCRFVDEVIIGAPLQVSKEMIETMRIKIVCCGTVSSPEEDAMCYKIPADMGILKTVESPSTLTTTQVIQRIISNRLNYEERNRKKQEKEVAEIALRALKKTLTNFSSAVIEENLDLKAEEEKITTTEHDIKINSSQNEKDKEEDIKNSSILLALNK